MTARLRAPRELRTAALQAAVIRVKSRPKPTLPARVNTEICAWLENNFYIAAAVQARAAAIREAQALADAEGEPFNEDDVPDPEETNEGRIVLAPFQKCLLRLALTRGPDGRFPYNAVVWSSTKKTGKSAIAAGVGYWTAETQTVFGDIACIGNDAKQSRERSFRDIRRAIMLTPGYDRHRKALPGRWIVQETQLTCITTQSRIVPLALDAAGEAGGATAITLWTEAWGLISKEALTMYAEMAPAPTLPDSIRWIESYAGFEDESMLLWGLYEQREAEHSHQLTAHDLAMAGSLNKRLQTPGETYEELLEAFVETEGDPEALVPVWVNENTGMMIYWDEGEAAHRMPWLRGEKGRRYYATERATQTPNTYERIHLNHWVGSEESFVPMELWERCMDPDLPPLSPETPIVLGVDAASTQDCFAIVAVSRHPKRPDDPALRAARVWKPPPRGTIDYDEPEAFMRWLLVGGCPLGHPPPQPERGGISTPTVDAMRAACPACIAGERVPQHNVVQIAFDAFQLENMMGRFNREGLTWVKKFPQQNDRLIADRQLHTVIITGRLSWNFAREEDAAAMRSHIRNANVKLQKNDDSKMRLQKKSEKLKIDLCVATSMAVDRCLRIIMS